MLWLKSRNSEVWLDRRTTYTRSTAVMSMVGYLLGLGDRHPSNLMLDRYSGKLLHIDFGDCFEASMNREKFPEKVPFRLTRMMDRAMEVSGIEGNFRCGDGLHTFFLNRPLPSYFPSETSSHLLVLVYNSTSKHNSISVSIEGVNVNCTLQRFDELGMPWLYLKGSLLHQPSYEIIC